MAGDFRAFSKQVRRIEREIERSLPIAALRGGTVIELRAKQILHEKGHIRTGNLRRNITTQLGPVTKTSAVALVGASPIYAESVEKLPIGARVARRVTKGGNIVNRGEGGGYLFPASVEKLAAAIRVAAETLDRAIKTGARGGA